jgi:hypothetical protein
MGLKDLFGKTSEKIVTKKQLDNLYKEAESEGYIEEAIVDKERYLPVVDFSSAVVKALLVSGFKSAYGTTVCK